MTVAQLRKMLSYFDDDQEVFFSFPSGDYWGTILAREVDDVNLGMVKWSEYHRACKLVDEDPDNRDEDEELKEVLILTY